MRRGVFLLLACLGLFLSIAPDAQGGGPRWQAWLYHAETRHMTQVDEAGTVLRDRTLPIPESPFNVLSNTVGVSHDGRLIAYFVTHESTLEQRFQIYDVEARTMLSGLYRPTFVPDAYRLHSLDFMGGTRLFNRVDTMAAIGYNPDESWELSVIDLGARRVVHTLRGSDPLATAAGVSDGFGHVPVVQHFEGSRVWFTIALGGTEGPAEFENYVWDFTANTVAPSVRYPQIISDTFLPTNEVLVPVEDPTLPNRLDSLPIPRQLNTVHVFDPSANARFAFYNDSNVTFSQAVFVENGQRVLADAYIFDTSERTWRLLERNGTLLDGERPIYEYNSLAGVGDGFIYVATNVVAEGRGVLIHTRTDDNNIDDIDSVYIAPVGSFPRIVWVSDSRAETVGPFTSWQRLGDYIAAPTLGEPPAVTSTPASRPLAAGDLSIGGRARVYTTEGDLLNVRSGPGPGFEVVAQLPIDTRVTVREGPVVSGGLRWWRIEMDDGRQGWAVDFVDDIPTLIPE